MDDRSSTWSVHASRESWHYTMEPSPSGTLLGEPFQFLWCSLANRAAELMVPRGRQVNEGIEDTVRRIKRAADAVHATEAD